MAKKKIRKVKITTKGAKLSGDDRIIDLLERFGVGLLYADTKLGQNNIAQIMGMGDVRVNKILKGIKKPHNLKSYDERSKNKSTA